MQVVESAKQVQVSFSPLMRRYTLEEFWELPDPGDRSHYELIGGYLFMSPPPEEPHDSLDSRLNRWLILFMDKNSLPGDVYHPQASVYTDDTYLVPDMMYVSHDLKKKMGKRRTSADVVFEYLSKSNANYDRTTKADTYLALGVRELWLVDSVTITIEVRVRVPGEPLPTWEVIRYGKGEVAQSRVLEGWRVSVDELFGGLVEKA